MKPSAGNANRKIIPAQVPPTLERVCIPVRVPNDPEWIALFVGAVYDLTKASRWDKDAAKLAFIIADVWKEVFVQMQSSMVMGEQCNDLGIPTDGCVLFMPNAPFFSYAPNNPFQTPLLTPPGYFMPPFYTNPGIPLPGVLPTDAMVNFAAIPAAATLPEILASGFPRIRIPFSGAGEVEIELVRVPQGGIAIITLDGGTTQTKVLDLNSVTIVGLPAIEDILDVVLEPNIAETEIIEIKTAAPGAHFIDITFLPNFGGEVLLGFGGGLRRVSYCDGAQPGEVPVPEFRITDCHLEWRPDDAGAWTDLGNVCGADGADGADGTAGASGADARFPIGAILPYASASLPEGWLFCDGAAVSRATYAALFAVIGTVFGAGNGTTTFNLPDTRQRTLRGIGTGEGAVEQPFTLGHEAGADKQVLTISELPDHVHGTKRRINSTAGTSAQLMAASGTGTSEPDVTTGIAVGSVTPPEPVHTVPRALGVNMIIYTGLDTNDLAIEFQVVDCQLQWRKKATDSFVDVPGGDLTACLTPGDPGPAPELRLVAVDADTYLLEYKYIGMPDDPEFWHDAGTFDIPTGVIGEDGRTPQIRLTSIGVNFYALEWKYTDDPDLSALWRTAGTFHTGGTDTDIPTPIEEAHANACGMAYHITDKLSSILDDTLGFFEATPDFSTALADAYQFLITSIAQGIDMEELIKQANDILIESPATIRSTLLNSDIEIKTQLLFCDFVVFGYSFNVLRSWANNIMDDVASPVGLKLWAQGILINGAAYWDAQAYLGSLSPSNLCELNPCDAFDQPRIGVEFFTKAGSIFEQDPTYTVDVVLRFPGGGQIGDPIEVFIRDAEASAQNGVDYEFTPTSVTFPATAESGSRQSISVAINNDDTNNGTRKFQLLIDSIDTVVDNVQIGLVSSHVVTIYDNETLALVVADGRGANLHLVGEWLYEVDAVQDSNTWRAEVQSAVIDLNNCWKLKQIFIMVGAPTGYRWRPCGSTGGTIDGLPTVEQLLNRFYAHGNNFFRIRLLIEPE